MVRVFISYKERADFKHRKNANLTELFYEMWEKYGSDMDYSTKDLFVPIEKVRKLRAGLYVYVYVRVEESDKRQITKRELRCILKTIYGREGITWITMMENELYAMVPRWQDPIILDKNGSKYDLRNAIETYANGYSWQEVWDLINDRRRRKGKPPYKYVNLEDCEL